MSFPFIFAIAWAFVSSWDAAEALGQEHLLIAAMRAARIGVTAL